MSVQFILPLLHENHPTFSQAQIRALMTSLPPNSTSSYTTGVKLNVTIGYLHPNMAACETGFKFLSFNIHEELVSYLIFTITR